MFKVGDKVQIVEDCPENLHDYVEFLCGVSISNLYGVVCTPSYLPYGGGSKGDVLLDVPIMWFNLYSNEYLGEHHVNHAALKFFKPGDKLKNTISRIENRHKRLANV